MTSFVERKFGAAAALGAGVDEYLVDARLALGGEVAKYAGIDWGFAPPSYL